MEKNISKKVVIDKLFDTLSSQLDEFIECRFNDLTNKYDNQKEGENLYFDSRNEGEKLHFDSRNEGEDLHDLIRKHYWAIFYNLNSLCDFTRDAVKSLLEDEESEDHS